VRLAVGDGRLLGTTTGDAAAAAAAALGLGLVVDEGRDAPKCDDVMTSLDLLWSVAEGRGAVAGPEPDDEVNAAVWFGRAARGERGRDEVGVEKGRSVAEPSAWCRLQRQLCTNAAARAHGESNDAPKAGRSLAPVLSATLGPPRGTTCPATAPGISAGPLRPSCGGARAPGGGFDEAAGGGPAARRGAGGGWLLVDPAARKAPGGMVE